MVGFAAKYDEMTSYDCWSRVSSLHLSEPALYTVLPTECAHCTHVGTARASFSQPFCTARKNALRGRAAKMRHGSRKLLLMTSAHESTTVDVYCKNDSREYQRTPSTGYSMHLATTCGLGQVPSGHNARLTVANNHAQCIRLLQMEGPNTTTNMTSYAATAACDTTLLMAGANGISLYNIRCQHLCVTLLVTAPCIQPPASQRTCTLHDDSASATFIPN